MPESDISAYHVLWYLAGAMLLGVGYFAGRRRTAVLDLAVVAALELASVTGNLPWFGAHPGVPGSIIYPVTLAGGLFVVVNAGCFVVR